MSGDSYGVEMRTCIHNGGWREVQGMREFLEGFFFRFFFIGRRAREGVHMFFVAQILGQAHTPCGVESSCDTLPRVRRGWRGPWPLFGCLWQLIFAMSGDVGCDFRYAKSW